MLAPLYDLLNTRLHLPNDSFMALDLFEDNYYTEKFNELGFFSYLDFFEFGRKIGLNAKEIDEFLQSIPDKIPKIGESLDNSGLSSKAIAKYKDYVADRAKMLT